MLKLNRPLFRRKKFLVCPSFQIKVALLVFLFLVGFTLFVGAFLFYPLMAQLESTGSSAVASQIIELHERLWPPLLAAEGLSAILFVFFAHRVAGPVHRVQGALERFLTGDYKCRIELRAGDEFRELVPLINALGEHLQKLNGVAAQKRSSEVDPFPETVAQIAAPARDEGPALARRRETQRGFSYIELIILVALTLLLAAMVLPYYLDTIEAAREAAAIATLAQIHNAQSYYFILNRKFAGTFDELTHQPIISLELRDRQRKHQGYEFDLDSKPHGRWSAEAHPVVGKRKTAKHFYMDQSGVIRYEHGRGAGDGSPRL